MCDDCETNYCGTPSPLYGAGLVTRELLDRAGAELIAAAAPIPDRRVDVETREATARAGRMEDLPPEISLTASDPARAALKRLGWQDAEEWPDPGEPVSAGMAALMELQALRNRVEELEQRARPSLIAPSPEWINRVKASRNDQPEPVQFWNPIDWPEMPSAWGLRSRGHITIRDADVAKACAAAPGMPDPTPHEVWTDGQRWVKVRF